MKKILDQIEDLSVESSFNLVKDFLKRVGAGILIGLGIAILFGWLSYKVSFFNLLLNGYELLSYDSRMTSRTANVEQETYDNIVIIDIDNISVAPEEEGGLGRYHNWPQAYHGELINTVSSGNPAAIIFDIIFDKEITEKWNKAYKNSFIKI